MNLREEMSSACLLHIKKVVKENGLKMGTYLEARDVARIIGSSLQAAQKMMLARGRRRIMVKDLVEMYTDPEIRIHPKRNPYAQ